MLNTANVINNKKINGGNASGGIKIMSRGRSLERSGGVFFVFIFLAAFIAFNLISLILTVSNCEASAFIINSISSSNAVNNISAAKLASASGFTGAEINLRSGARSGLLPGEIQPAETAAVRSFQLPADKVVPVARPAAASENVIAPGANAAGEVFETPDSAQFSQAEIDIINKIRQREEEEKARVITSSYKMEQPPLVHNAGQSALSASELPERRRGRNSSRPYKPLEITGEKVFILDDVSVQGDFSRFAADNFGAYPGFKYSSELRLNIDGNIAENIRVSANLDDTNISQETKKVTLYIDGRYWNFTLGDFTTSFNDTEFTLYNKKLKGIEAVGTLADGKYQIKAIASRSEGKSQSDVFTGSGMQSEYQFSQRPVVQNSEKITLDGRLLKKGSDYTIDYEDGSIIIKPHLLPLESRNRITAEYEYFENGTLFRRTLVGVRGTAALKNLNKIGFSVIREEDDKGSVKGAAETDVQIKPTSSTIYGFDYKLNPLSNLKLDGELALSVLDQNTLSNEKAEDKNINSAAFYTKAAYTAKKYSLDLRKQKMGRDFISIGKNRLDIDEDRNEAILKLMPLDRLNFQFDYEDSRRASLNDPDLPSSVNARVDINNKALRTFSTYYFRNKKSSADFSTYERLKRNDSSMLDFHEQIYQGELKNEHNKTIERLRYNLRTINSKYDLTRKQNEYTHNLGVSSTLWDRLNYALEFSNIKTDAGQAENPVSNIKNYSLDVTSNLTKKLSLNTVFLSRIEENIQTNRTDNLIATDAKIRYNPSKKVQGQVRYKESHSKKFLLDKTYNEKILQVKEGTTTEDNYITVEEPVTTRTGSFLIDILPTAKIRSQLQYQFKNLVNITTRARMSVSDSAMMEFKYAPNRNLSSIYRLMNAKNTQNVGEYMASRNLNHNLELRKSLNAKTALISNTEADYKTDVYRPLENADTYSQGLRFEKDLSSALNVTSGLAYAKIDRISPYYDSNKVSLLGGFRLIPKRFRMTLRSNLDYSIEDDEVSKRHRTILDNFIDYDLGGDTALSANYKFVNSGKTSYEEGYKARIGKMTLTKRF